MRIRIIVILFISACYSCNPSPYMVPDQVKKAFYCYNGKATGIDSLIDIKGYYGNGLFFFSDGIFIMAGDNGNHSACDYMKLIANQEKYPKYYLNRFYFGIYKIDGTLIKAQYLDPSYAYTYYGRENWYQIIDRNHIKLIYCKTLAVPLSEGKKVKVNTYENHKPNKVVEIIEDIGTEEYIKDAEQLTFVPACDTLQVSKTWLKKQRWFWCKHTW